MHKSIIYQYFRKKWLFLVYLIVGVTAFLFICNSINIPIYKTLESRIIQEENEFRLFLTEPISDVKKPIYIYHSREEYVEIIQDYTVEDRSIRVKSFTRLQAGDEVKIDYQIEEISLLKLIFLRGGNS